MSKKSKKEDIQKTFFKLLQGEGNLEKIRELYYANTSKININGYKAYKPYLFTVIDHPNKDYKIQLLELLLSFPQIDINTVYYNETALTYALEKKAYDCVVVLIRYGADVNIVPNVGTIALAITCKDDDIDMSKILLDNKANPNIVDIYGYIILNKTCRTTNSPELIKLLLSYGADINRPDNRGNTPIIESIYNEKYSLEILEILLKHGGVDINHKNNEGDNALIIACKNKRIDLVDLLTKQENIKIDDIIGKDKQTALMTVCTAKYFDINILKLLLERKANPNILSDEGNSALTYLIFYKIGNIEAVELLIKYGADIDMHNDNKYSILSYACLPEFRNIEIIETLLRHKANPNLETKKGIYPLYVTTHGVGASPELTKLLIKYGADVNKGNDINTRPIHNSAYRETTEIAKILIDNGAELNVENESAQIPLISACEKMNFEMVKLFLENGANPNLENKKSFYPLFVSTHGATASPEITKLLIKHGADVNKGNDINTRPIHNAPFRETTEIAQILIANNAELNVENESAQVPLISACEKNNFEMVKLFLENGSNPNYQNKKGNTPLLMACNESDIEIIELLIKSGADTNLIDNNLGISPLLVAYGRFDTDILKLILDNGANIDFKNEYYGGVTVLMKACLDEVIFIKTLLEYNPDLSITNNSGETVLDIARMTENTEIMRLLNIDIDINFYIEKLSMHFPKNSINFNNLFKLYEGFCKNDLCSFGFNSIELEDYRGKTVTELNNANESNNIKGILNPLTGDILCIDIEEEKQYWEGMDIEGVILEDTSNKEFDRVYQDSDNNVNFLRFLAHSLYFLEDNVDIILASNSNLFILVATQFRWIDVNSGSSVYHNKYKGGDTVYLIIPC